jgi:hypothetical protein
MKQQDTNAVKVLRQWTLPGREAMGDVSEKNPEGSDMYSSLRGVVYRILASETNCIRRFQLLSESKILYHILSLEDRRNQYKGSRDL